MPVDAPDNAATLPFSEKISISVASGVRSFMTRTHVPLAARGGEPRLPRAFGKRGALLLGLRANAIRTADVDHVVARFGVGSRQRCAARVAHRVVALSQVVIDRYALIEHETLAVETIVRAGAFKIFRMPPSS